MTLERLLFVLVAGVLACGGGGSSSSHTSCSSPGRCANQVLMPGEISSCEASLADACGADFQALIDCAAGVEQCDADGTEDGQASLAASATACSGTRKVWVACERALLDAASGE